MRLYPAGISLPKRRRRRARTRLLLAGASGLTVLLAAGCASNTGGTGGSSTIKIAAVPGIGDAPIYLAQHNGLFAAAGLNVQIVNYRTDAAELIALQQGQVDIAASDYGTVFASQEQGNTSDLRILADGYDATSGGLAVLTMPGSSISSPTGLEGQAIGVPNYDTLPGIKAGHPISLESAAANQALFSYLAAGSNTVTWVPMTQPAELHALKTGKVKAILVSEPFVYQAESQFGAVQVLDAASGSTANLPLYGYVSTEAWVKSHGATVAAFKSALSRAQTQAAMAGPLQQTLQRTPVGLTKEQAALVTIGTFPTSTNANDLDRVARIMVGAAMLKSPLDVASMIVR
ncbi:MAG TPA: ABC transporter substrate-binding protein [Streptosporangiaceae bacterium]|jgi:NitT/TauT family transport system substrate-binding protein